VSGGATAFVLELDALPSRSWLRCGSATRSCYIIVGNAASMATR
jgi:hypothetical protein